ncbi:cell wall-associated hydrolases (Invasion-associated proteins) [Lachnospiraceae bacterium CAG:25]|nr:cell wall-associated hydrolases (Invasion-associated proteins) [Lachnospiraceae bacterium CAG:25]
MTIRKKASTSAAKAGFYKKGTQITCYGERSGWTTVRYSGVYCYVSSQYLSESKPEEDTWEVYGTATGQSVVDYAMQFRGNPYVWGGESLTNGVDCSGFTMQVYKHFGYSLPHSSTAQRYEGTAVSWDEKQPGDLICYQVVNGVGHVAIYSWDEKQPGDLICYQVVNGVGHVAIYIGDNQIIHAGSKDTGINVRNADYRAVWGVRRIVQ